MSGKTAIRNVRLCEKDCLCLYVCPTGASDTENSVIDVDKCIGCGACAEACPAGAISLVPRQYPPQQAKESEVITALRQLAGSKAEQEELSSALPGTLAKALERSNRIMAEDLLREAGYMLPQSCNVHALLEEMRSHTQEPGFPADALEYLLSSIEFNEPTEKKEEGTMEKWKCSVCGYVCPVCKQPADKFVKMEEDAPKKNPYAGTQTEKNLEAAFAGESQARNKYTYFASTAKKEGYEQIAALFLKTAENEKEHAKIWFKELNGIGSTADNLKAAADGENYEWTDMYEGFAVTAEKRAKSRSGNAGTAAILLSEPRLRRSALYVRIRKAILKSTLRIINLLTIQTECYHDVPCMICRELFCRFIVDNNLLHRKSQSTLVEFDRF